MNISRERHKITVYKKKEKEASVPGCVAHNYYSFDIEVGQYVLYHGKMTTSDSSKHEYSGYSKAQPSLYMAKFGINDTVYYGRNFSDFEKALIDISDIKIHKIGFIIIEFQFLLNIFVDKYAINKKSIKDTWKPNFTLITKEPK